MASHIGSRPITIPSNVEVTLTDTTVSVKGPKGQDSFVIPEGISVKHEGNELVVTPLNKSGETSAKHGLTRSIIASQIEGVERGFRKELEIVGTGYRVALKGNTLTFSLGYSHTIDVPAPEGISFEVKDATHLAVLGIDKQKVGEVAAEIRRLRAPEPYKGKGVKYVGEYIRRKAGKAGK
ncbi:50S ribosomal protein L6 [Aeriscardovia aeriphila]|uniref:Large ribosomal subunit protein uL6 n=1 Tax=Aeriscardovia aeriphila TaxID=218139 RepID=A0A261F9C8_9BIFI|nr:50S ribosomal protein L6 [Aeriscardovia aeriphila]NYI26091.1 large subunit ribosomal protein L6 [Aeriscardovia aeriphila]OZG55761.1 50S ribosomal protein L6 [Aeriscardovia aeriphila]